MLTKRTHTYIQFLCFFGWLSDIFYSLILPHKSTTNGLDRLLDSWLAEVAPRCCWGAVSGSDTSITVDLEQTRHVELWLLEDFDLTDVDVVHWVDLLARVLNFFGDRVRDELLDEFLEVATGCFSLEDVDHLCPDDLLLCRLCVRSLSDLELGLLGEANDEDSDNVAVSRLNVAEALDEGLPLLDERLQFIRGKVHAVEVGEEASALDVLNLQADLSVERLVVLEVVEADLVDTAHETILCKLHTLGSRHDGVADVSLGEVGWGFDIIPFLFLEDINVLLTLTLVLVQLLLVTKERKKRRDFFLHTREMVTKCRTRYGVIRVRFGHHRSEAHAT